jgi:SAM-dependent methyltransferase
MCSRSGAEPAPRAAPSVLDRLADEERALASSGLHRWYAAYVGRTYTAAVGRALAAGGDGAIILKTDLWNEGLGGERDVLGSLGPFAAARRVGVDLSLSVCAAARSRTPDLAAVQADIRALPFRAGSMGALLDLSVIDHVPGGVVPAVIAEYRRVLSPDGVLLVVFWQRSAAVRLRVWLKRAFARPEKPGQHYFARAMVRDAVTRSFAITHEFAAGTLLVLPMRAVGLVLRALPAAAAKRAVAILGEREVAGMLRPVLRHLSGLYGVVAR